MPTYSVDTAAVTDTAARTRARIATIQTEVDGMRGDIGLLQSCWTGTASDSMAACAADWHLTQLQVQSNLDQISLALDNAAVCYDDAETSNRSRFATSAPAPAPAPAPATGSAPLGAGRSRRLRSCEDSAASRPQRPHIKVCRQGPTRHGQAPATERTRRRAAPHVRERRPAAVPGAGRRRGRATG